MRTSRLTIEGRFTIVWRRGVRGAVGVVTRSVRMHADERVTAHGEIVEA